MPPAVLVWDPLAAVRDHVLARRAGGATREKIVRWWQQSWRGNKASASALFGVYGARMSASQAQHRWFGPALLPWSSGGRGAGIEPSWSGPYGLRGDAAPHASRRRREPTPGFANGGVAGMPAPGTKETTWPVVSYGCS